MGRLRNLSQALRALSVVMLCLVQTLKGSVRAAAGLWLWPWLC